MQACEVLLKNKEKLLKRWEDLSLARLPEAQNLSRGALRDHMPKVFEKLCDVLKTGEVKKQEPSKTHGRQRGISSDYSLAEVMGEYSILKNIIFDELGAADALSVTEMRLIDKFFDAASSTAIVEFVALREYELNAVTDSLVSINQDLETFAAIAAHDLRSPTSTILGYAELLAQEASPAGGIATKAVETIHRTASRMLELIDQLLDYAKMGKEHLIRGQFPLEDAVNEAVDNLSSQIEETGAKVRVGALPSYNGDQILIRQVFQNLISNSIKFRVKDRPCEVSVTGSEADGLVRVSVEDNCSGFDSKLSELIFQPFKRGTNRPDTRGSGIGLATVRKIIELHGGKVWAEGEVNRGAKFTIELPVP